MRFSFTAVILTVCLAAAAPQKALQVPTAEPKIKPAEIKVTLQPGIGKKAPALEGLTWIKGKPLKIEPGRAYLIEFWATWCPPCRETIPHLTELQKKYIDKISIVGISTEKAEIVKLFVDKMGDQMNYTIAADTQGKAAKNYSEAYNMQGIPHGFVIDQKGQIVWYGHPQEGLVQVLEQVAEGKFDPMAFAREKAEAEALNNQLQLWYTEFFATIQAEGSNEKTDRIAEQFIEKAHPEALLSFSWNILIKLKSDKRSLQMALKAAQKATQMTNGTEPMVLDTLAAALFENGQFAEAIAVEQKAVEKSHGDKQMQEMLMKRLMDFKAKANRKTALEK